jgi:hypothetical protein
VCDLSREITIVMNRGNNFMIYKVDQSNLIWFSLQYHKIVIFPSLLILEVGSSKTFYATLMVVSINHFAWNI